MTDVCLEAREPIVTSCGGGQDGTGNPFETFYRLAGQKVYRPVALALGSSDLALGATDGAMTRAAACRDNPATTTTRPSGSTGRPSTGLAPVSGD